MRHGFSFFTRIKRNYLRKKAIRTNEIRTYEKAQKAGETVVTWPSSVSLFPNN